MWSHSSSARGSQGWAWQLQEPRTPHSLARGCREPGTELALAVSQDAHQQAVGSQAALPGFHADTWTWDSVTPGGDSAAPGGDSAHCSTTCSLFAGDATTLPIRPCSGVGEPLVPTVDLVLAVMLQPKFFLWQYSQYRSMAESLHTQGVWKMPHYHVLQKINCF